MNPIRKFFSRILGTNNTSKRFAAGTVDRLSLNFLGTNRSADAQARPYLERIRDRARVLERDDSIMRRFLQLLEDNVIGAGGVKLQSKIFEVKKGKGGAPSDKTFDTNANDAVERAWNEWCKVKNCDVAKRSNFTALCKMMLRSTARDGEMLVKFHYGDDAGNPFGFGIQLIEADLIDTNYNVKLTNGNEIIMGIEKTKLGRPVAIHMFAEHPGNTAPDRTRVRVETKDIIHVCRADRVGQSRGYSWAVSVMINLDQFSKYIHAEVVAARAASCKMGFITMKTPEGWTGNEDDEGNGQLDLQPGQIEQLPMGMDYKAADPQHPTSQVEGFIRAFGRLISGGFGSAYHRLFSDAESVNFTASREARLDDAEYYKGIQDWLISTVISPIFEEWLKHALSMGQIKDANGQAMPTSKYEKFNQPLWVPRRWDWVDPKAEAEAAVIAINNGVKSRSEIIAERGGDIEDVFRQMAADNALAKKHGLTFQTVSGQMVTPGATTGATTDAKPTDTTTTDDTAPEPTTDVPTKDVQSTALNGAQVTALSELAVQVAAGALPLEAAQAIALVSFPDVDVAKIEAIFASLANFKPTVPEPAPEPTAQPADTAA